MSDCNFPEVYGNKTRKARKKHRCCECLGVIKAGERYSYHHGVWDGQGRSFKRCADCEHIACSMDEECVAFGCLGEELTAYEDSYPELRAAFYAVKAERAPDGS